MVGKLIMEPGDREALLERLESSTSAVLPKPLEGALPSPFREAATAPSAVERAEPALEWSEAEALEQIAKTFIPTGSLIKGGIGYLLVSRGQRIGEGEAFEARVRDKRFRVEVVAVTESTYRLRLGEAVYEGTFENEEGR